MVNQLYNRFAGFWTTDKSFTFLLVTLCVYVFGLIPLLTEDIFSKVAFLFFYYLLLTSSIPFLLRRNKKAIAGVLVFVPLLFFIIEILFTSLWLQVLTDFFIVIYCIMLGYIILTRTFAQGRITSKRVQGAIIVYLLTGLVFCLLYHSIYLLESVKSFNGLVGTHRKEFLYFSICTLTTDGYGDIIPMTPIARSLSNLEALMGQLYPAVLIARLVSMEFSYKKDQP